MKLQETPCNVTRCILQGKDLWWLHDVAFRGAKGERKRPGLICLSPTWQLCGQYLTWVSEGVYIRAARPHQSHHHHSLQPSSNVSWAFNSLIWQHSTRSHPHHIYGHSTLSARHGRSTKSTPTSPTVEKQPPQCQEFATPPGHWSQAWMLWGECQGCR